MRLISGLFMIAIYRMAPRWFAFHSLRGLMKQRGIDIAGIPLSATRELANNALHEHQRESKFFRYSMTKDAAEFSTKLEVTAYQVDCLLRIENRADKVLDICRAQYNTLVAHGVKVRPILTPNNGP